MKKRFKSKNNKIINFKIMIFILFFIVSFGIFTNHLIKKIYLNIDDEFIVNYLINNESKTFDFKKYNNPEFIFEYTFGTTYKVKEEPVFKETKKESIIENKDPIIYIYNTHTTESYQQNQFEIFNIKPTVITASYILKEYLEEENIYAIVEEERVADIVIKNKWKYSDSYKASRTLLEDTKTKYPSLKYYIDIHRDSSSKEITTLLHENKSYARIMFVVGIEHNNYEYNYNLSKRLNDEINKFIPKLSRGVIKKEGKGVDGIYNQDFSPNAILIEIGGQYNKIDEINNTLAILSEVIRITLGD